MRGLRPIFFTTWTPDPINLQGNRILVPSKSRENLEQSLVVPAGDQALAAETGFAGSVLLQNRHDQAAEHPKILRPAALAHPALVFGKSYIQTPVQGGFNTPVATHGAGEGLDLCFEAGDVEGHLFGDVFPFLAGP